MVVKCETCVFSEMKIYPGHGSYMIRRDGKLLRFVDSRSQAMYKQGKKAQRLKWSMVWRRHNKKVKAEVIVKRARKRRVRLQKAVGALSIEDLKKKAAQKTEFRLAKKQAAVQSAKGRKDGDSKTKKTKQQKNDMKASVRAQKASQKVGKGGKR